MLNVFTPNWSNYVIYRAMAKKGYPAMYVSPAYFSAINKRILL